MQKKIRFDKKSLRDDFHKKNGKKDDIVYLSNYPHPPGLIMTSERVTNHIWPLPP